MALNWRWDNKVGKIECERLHDGKPYTVTLYEGNAYLIMLCLYKDKDGDDVYDMHSFWVDKDHAKRCLGIDAKYSYTFGENMYKDAWKNITIYRDKLGTKKTSELVGMLAKAFEELTITITNEPKKESEGA